MTDAEKKARITKEKAIGTLIGVFIVAPLFLLLLWNYGGTELIEALGGPDANLNIVDGWLAAFCFAAITTMFRKGGFPPHNGQ
jgi:hypothetical protein